MLLIVLHLLWLLVVLLSSVTTLLLLEATAPIISSSWRPAHTCNHAKPVMRQRRAPRQLSLATFSALLTSTHSAWAKNTA